eukprot:6446580-Lingulodinium_polyedra.AAC.1
MRLDAAVSAVFGDQAWGPARARRRMGELARRIESHTARVADVDNGQESRATRAILALAVRRRAT